MKYFLHTTLLSGLRSRIFQLILFLGVLLVGVAYLASMFSPRQPQTVALDVGLSGMRITLVLLGLFWVLELFSREVEQKTVILNLSYPVDRSCYVLGRFFGIASLLALAAVVIASLLWVAVLASSGGYPAARQVALGWPYVMTVLGLYVDVLVVTAFALCLATLSTVMMLPLALGGIFAIAGKSLGSVIDFLLVRQGDGDDQIVSRFGPVIEVLRWVLPDLSRLDWRNWPLYQLPPEGGAIVWTLLMAFSFAMLFLGVGIGVFRRREFS